MAGPAYFLPLPSPHLPLLLYLTGPACHCGRSRLSPSIFSTSLLPLTLSYRPGLSLWQVPPFHPPSSLSSPFLPFPPPSYRPGLSLWQVPPISGFYLLSLRFLFYLIHTDPYQSLPTFKIFRFESKLPQITTDLYRSSQILTESHTHAYKHISHTALHTSLYYQNTLKNPKDPHRCSNILTDPTDPSICLTTFEIPTGPHKFP